jgi:hypothetical protein
MSRYFLFVSRCCCLVVCAAFAFTVLADIFIVIGDV